MKRITTICVIIILALLDITAQDELTLLATIQGENEGDRFAHVDAVGDINGDGYKDFIIGGKGDYLKLYFGSENFDTTNYIRFNKGTWKRVFASGCGVGDLNGDGYNDFVINTMFNVWDYRVYVYFGGEEIDTTNYLVIRNTEYWYSGFGGASISGDFNSDGYDDLVISAPNDDIDARGRVYIYVGGEQMNTECDVYLEGKEPGDNFGNSVSIIGDVNGDGYDDLLVGAPFSGQAGKAYLFWGSENIGFDNCVEFFGSVTGSPYGFIVAGLGDINDDGFSDFGILAWTDYIDIFLGGVNVSNSERFLRFSGDEYFFISGLNNINNDEYDDYIITSSTLNIYLGSSNPDTVSSIQADFWGHPVRPLGDINGDGKNDIAIGYSYGEQPNGTVFIYSYEKISSVEILPETITNDFKVKQNYPNPFNPSTKIRYTVYEACELDLIIYDITGKEINRLFTGYQIPGSYEMTWEGVDNNNTKVASGVYLLRVSAQPTTSNSILQQKVIKLMLIR